MPSHGEYREDTSKSYIETAISVTISCKFEHREIEIIFAIPFAMDMNINLAAKMLAVFILFYIFYRTTAEALLVVTRYGPFGLYGSGNDYRGIFIVQ